MMKLIIGFHCFELSAHLYLPFLHLCPITSSGFCHSKCLCFYWLLLFPMILLAFVDIPQGIRHLGNILERLFFFHLNKLSRPQRLETQLCNVIFSHFSPQGTCLNCTGPFLYKFFSVNILLVLMSFSSRIQPNRG